MGWFRNRRQGMGIGALVVCVSGCNLVQDLGADSIGASTSSVSASTVGGSGGSGGSGGAPMIPPDAGDVCASDAGSPGAGAVRLVVQPADQGWNVTYGEATAPCAEPNPTEAMFTDECTPGGD